MYLTIRTKYPQVLVDYQWPTAQIRQQVGSFEYEYHGPKIEIDQQDALNELGMGNLDHLVRTSAAAGRQAVVDGIARRAREGDRFAREMIRQDTAVQLAKEQMFDEIPEINVDVAPKSRPKLLVSMNSALGGGLAVQRSILLLIRPRLNGLKAAWRLVWEEAANSMLKGDRG